jgi:hypothetical protein
MSETAQIILGLLFLAVVFVLTRLGIALRIRRACQRIIRDLENQNAVDPESAVGLAYERRSLLHMGVRDFRPKALEAMIQDGVVVRTEAGRYYLRRRPQP